MIRAVCSGGTCSVCRCVSSMPCYYKSTDDGRITFICCWLDVICKKSDKLEPI